MRIIITFMFEILNQIAVMAASNHFYFKLINEKALFPPMMVTDANSSIECAAHCTAFHGCYRAQLVSSVCELLSEPQVGEPIQLSHESSTIYMYRNSCNATLCENGGACVANATGTFCECERGYGGSLCQIECDVTRNNCCYKLHEGQLGWLQAKELCEQNGGRLPEICDEETNNLIQQMITDQSLYRIWLGATDEAVEGQWEWVTGSCPFSTFEDWYPGGPGISHENYLSTNMYSWMDDSMPQLQDVVCEFY